MISQKNKQGWRNPWVIGLALIVVSGVLVNARMLWNVMHHPTRLLDENYSVREHNKYEPKWVQQQAERSSLGWKVILHSPQRLENDPMAWGSSARFILLGNPSHFKLQLNDSEGKPVQGGQVVINAQWPGNPEFDKKTTLVEAAPGNYEGELDFSRPGNWDLIIETQRAESVFETEQKVFVASESK